MKVTSLLYSGQAWEVPNVEELFIAEDMISINLLCGCIKVQSQEIVTYTVQENDSLTGIGEILSAKLSGIEDLNERLIKNPSYIEIGWVLFVPMEKKGRQGQKQDATFESERPVLFSVDEIDKATSNFNVNMKIGEGGYGSVYIGLLKERVELLGYASGDNHLYLVYEYIQNGSLSDHLHDPMLKGHTPLTWTARAQIALDAARGIEYIHDHTKAQYVHRDIKTSNILLDQGLRAKVSDFGLAKLVERSNEEDFIATRLVGTPGYIAPESVRELQMTTKSDIFAFGVVLAELITGQRALMRDNREPNKMKALITVILTIFKNQDIETALEANIDVNLKRSYPMEEVCEMAEISRQCLCEDPLNRPEMREIVQALSNILTSSIEWEASLGASSQDFAGIFVGR
ncbi:hypothetical protein JCGZ_11427 [Jatropha curcas]|uniref:Protein kinase domain-containing protein n=1 Tax=Jatropha curcas TaxID=180498 RepID=A0A067K4A1_JATCU|nr:hypothetical protein JCGZ_11427 [Jatropha curcas]